MGATYGETIRDYAPVDDVAWRFGKPSYERANKIFFRHRTKSHADGSLEAVVSKLVKNWEVEVHHVGDIKQWITMDTEKLQVSLNGGPKVGPDAVAQVGTHNFLLGQGPIYDGGATSLEDSYAIFNNAFTDGFAWEVLEVLSGPPCVAFRWRHFGPFSGTFVDKKGCKHQGNGEMLEFRGMVVAKVSEKLKIEELSVYFQPNDLLTPLTSKTKMMDSEVAFGGEDCDTTTKATPCCSTFG